jgi:hypothetical protein
MTSRIVSYPQVSFITLPLKQVDKRVTDNKRQSKTVLYRFWSLYYCVNITKMLARTYKKPWNLVWTAWTYSWKHFNLVNKSTGWKCPVTLTSSETNWIRTVLDTVLLKRSVTVPVGIESSSSVPTAVTLFSYFDSYIYIYIYIYAHKKITPWILLLEYYTALWVEPCVQGVQQTV